MNRDRLSHHLLIAFLLALALYVVGYWFIESRRIVQTPWRVSFEPAGPDHIEVVVRQETLGLGPVRIRVATTNSTLPVPAPEVAFNTPKPVPFPVPGGQCVFQDTTFLPGTVVLEIAGVAIQMLPRALTIGTNEFAWSTNRLIVVPAAGLPEVIAAPAP
jgi:hypothetical protein